MIGSSTRAVEVKAYQFSGSVEFVRRRGAAADFLAARGAGTELHVNASRSKWLLEGRDWVYICDKESNPDDRIGCWGGEGRRRYCYRRYTHTARSAIYCSRNGK